MEIEKMNRPKHREKIIRTLFKNFFAEYNSRSLSKAIGITHAGTFKILKKLEKENIVKSRKIGKAVVYSLNMENSRTITEMRDVPQNAILISDFVSCIILFAIVPCVVSPVLRR